MMRHRLTAAALALTLAMPAFAQQMNRPETATQSSASPGNFVQKQDATDSRGSKLIGATVYGPDNASIGEISDVVIANDGKIKAAVIGVGGFLGVGEKDVAVPFEQLTISRNAGVTTINKITVRYDKEALKNAPKFTFEQAPAATTGSSVTDKLNSVNPLKK